MRTIAIILLVIIVLGFLFAWFDYASILDWHWSDDNARFSDFRFYMSEAVAWFSPASFALAEHFFYLFVDHWGAPSDWSDGDYSGNWLNPDGQGNFIWGQIRYPMWKWYFIYGFRFVFWLFAVRYLNGLWKASIPRIWYKFHSTCPPLSILRLRLNPGR